MIYTGNDLGWLEVVHAFEHTAFRLEQERVYLADVRSGALNAWLAGDRTPPAPNDWSQFVERRVAAGAQIERVRVFEDEPTPYQQWLRLWSRKNVEAGERQAYLTRSQGDALGLTELADRDFWVLDDRTLVAFTFDTGERVVEVTSDPARVAAAAYAFHVANGRAVVETYETAVAVG